MSYKQETPRVRHKSESNDHYDISLIEGEDKHSVNKIDVKFDKKKSKGQTKKSSKHELKHKKESSEKVILLCC